eukprot:Blabericola_migrator_1__4472@NODE_238_length_10988_cov_97_569087_g202_i0_p3_GENE_NODE_238_length_10988_cov_97_569087_g202_i0NODE_238_length_10988_cov_97_569087_g202_i0_p3_ORF_typecomplete_len288_score51_09PRP38/PF03371_15/8_6e16_NODE_238_length_10988_cov_97_569087_g202_i064927355
MDDENIFVRVTAYVWLRFVHPPEKLWAWYESLFLDDTVFNPCADKSAQNETTIGTFVESLLTEDRYFSTVLPRLPVKVKTQYGLQLVTLSQHRRRKRRNKEKLWKFKKGAEVMACHTGEWRYGRFEGFYEDEVFGGNFALVKFDDPLEDEDEAIPIDLGLVIVLKKKHKRRRFMEAGDEAPADPTPSIPDEEGAIAASPEAVPQISTEDLMAEFKKKERERALASGKDYAKRPSSYKASLSVKLGHGPKPGVAGWPKTTEAVAITNKEDNTNEQLEKLRAKYQSAPS